jgi:HD superfamily phosphodiesterase
MISEISKEGIEELEAKLEEIAKDYYLTRDDSHGMDHVIKVARNTRRICQEENIKDQNMI